MILKQVVQGEQVVGVIVWPIVESVAAWNEVVNKLGQFRIADLVSSKDDLVQGDSVDLFESGFDQLAQLLDA